MQCPGHPDTIIGDVWHAVAPDQCIADGYPPLPGDPEWPADDAPPDAVVSANPE